MRIARMACAASLCAAWTLPAVGQYSERPDALRQVAFSRRYADDDGQFAAQDASYPYHDQNQYYAVEAQSDISPSDIPEVPAPLVEPEFGPPETSPPSAHDELGAFSPATPQTYEPPAAARNTFPAHDGGCGPWRETCRSACSAPDCACAEPVCRLLAPGEGQGWNLGGWFQLGTTTNPYHPSNPSAGPGNLPVTFNYRSDELQLHQAYVYAERETDGRCGWDLGGRVDLLFGEDYIFTQAAGLETHSDAVNHWNRAAGGNGVGGTGRMGLAMPQAYLEAAVGDLKFKLGHFYTIIGYETVAAVDNFFYSKPYTMQYGEPFTHSGALLTWEWSPQLSLSLGLVNGWDKFDAVSDRGALLCGANWTSCSQRTTLAFALISGKEDGADPPVLGNRTMYSIVLAHQLHHRWHYVFQHDYGWQNNGAENGQDAEWYGINQYLFYVINPCWRAGLRAEWFNDDDGTRVGGAVQGASPAAHWYEVALGLNYSPHPNLSVRPEVRWDFERSHDERLLGGPFDAADGSGRSNQFLAALDVILQF